MRPGRKQNDGSGDVTVKVKFEQETGGEVDD
jgi:hypothetical protein